MIDQEVWQDRIDRRVQRWWRKRGYSYADLSLCDDLRQALWLALYEGKIREANWPSDLGDALREAISLMLRGVPRGTISAPWPWAAKEITPQLRSPILPVATQALLRLIIARVWQRCSPGERLVWYGRCAVSGPLGPGPGSAGIPQHWAQGYGLTRIMVHFRLRAIRQRLARALG